MRQKLAAIIGDESLTEETLTRWKILFAGIFLYDQRTRFSCLKIVFETSDHFSSAMFLTSAFVYCMVSRNSSDNTARNASVNNFKMHAVLLWDSHSRSAYDAFHLWRWDIFLFSMTLFNSMATCQFRTETNWFSRRRTCLLESISWVFFSNFLSMYVAAQ